MTKRPLTPPRRFSLLCGLLLFVEVLRMHAAEPTPAAVAAFDTYRQSVEARLGRQHGSGSSFLVAVDDNRLRRGELVVERISPALAPADALLHHWRGTAFAPGARAEDFEELMRDFKAYPQHFAPQVVQAGVTTSNGDRMQAWMRVRQKHVITVVMDAAYDVRFGRLDPRHGYSISESTRIGEIDGHGRLLPASEDHGFLWRLNTYWSYEERDGGLYVQIEAVSLTRGVPRGLGWAVGPYVESVPRESMEFTLRSAVRAVRR